MSRLHILAVILATLLVAPHAALAAEPSQPATAVGGSILARFEGRWIDLAHGWGEAAACVVHDARTDCYRTIAEAEQHDTELAAVQSATDLAVASCSRSLRLYSSSYRSGNVLYLSTRGMWLNLSTYGFDNVTSSFQVGACATQLAAGSNGSGGLYKNSVFYADHIENTLGSWDNVPSSVYLF